METLKQKKDRLEKELKETEIQLEKNAKTALESLDELKSQLILLANQYNSKAASLNLDVAIGVLLSQPIRLNTDRYQDNNTKYLVRPHGRNVWFPSTENC